MASNVYDFAPLPLLLVLLLLLLLLLLFATLLVVVVFGVVGAIVILLHYCHYVRSMHEPYCFCLPCRCGCCCLAATYVSLMLWK